MKTIPAELLQEITRRLVAEFEPEQRTTIREGSQPATPGHTSHEARTGFWRLLDAAEGPTAYATLFRYPGDILEPDPIEFEQTLDDAEQFCTFILKTLPQEVRP